jgi:hypothetical protein
LRERFLEVRLGAPEQPQLGFELRESDAHLGVHAAGRDQLGVDVVRLLEIETGLVAAREPELRRGIARLGLGDDRVHLLRDGERFARVEAHRDALVGEREHRGVAQRARLFVEQLAAAKLDAIRRRVGEVEVVVDSVARVRDRLLTGEALLAGLGGDFDEHDRFIRTILEPVAVGVADLAEQRLAGAHRHPVVELLPTRELGRVFLGRLVVVGGLVALSAAIAEPSLASATSSTSASPSAPVLNRFGTGGDTGVGSARSKRPEELRRDGEARQRPQRRQRRVRRLDRHQRRQRMRVARLREDVALELLGFARLTERELRVRRGVARDVELGAAAARGSAHDGLLLDRRPAEQPEDRDRPEQDDVFFAAGSFLGGPRVLALGALVVARRCADAVG